MHMKLGKVTNNDPLERPSISLHASAVQQLHAYRAYYKGVHGDEITLSTLLEEIAKRFLREDRDFQKFYSAHPSAGADAK